MAGTVPGFNAAEVRAGLRLAMTVGLPPVLEEQPTFFFPREVSNTARADESKVPFNPLARPALAPPRSVRVPCAIEYFDNQGKIENFGVIVPSKVELTLLDEDHAKVRGFQFVVIGGGRFFYDRTETPLGLVSVGVYVVHCTAEDQA